MLSALHVPDENHFFMKGRITEKFTLSGSLLLSTILVPVLIVLFSGTGVASSGPMKGIKVNLSDATGKVNLNGVTNNQGVYMFPGVTPGERKLIVYRGMPLEGARVYALDEDGIIVHVDPSGKIPIGHGRLLAKSATGEWTAAVTIKGTKPSNFKCTILFDQVAVAPKR